MFIGADVLAKVMGLNKCKAYIAVCLLYPSALPHTILASESAPVRVMSFLVIILPIKREF
jgi:hypothetical protein